MDLNLNMLLTALTNFRIKYSMETDPTIIQVSNKDLVFVIEEPTHIPDIVKYGVFEFEDIKLNEEADRIEITIKRTPNVGFISKED